MQFLFYDLETSGLQKAHDQVLQFAAIRCDENLNQLETPSNLFCRPRNDLFPSPGAILANRLDLRQCQRQGLKEYDFAMEAHQVLQQPNTYIAGYNSKKFDDEFIRFLMYRNLMDPYRWGWDGGNKRTDVMDQVLLAHVFGRDVGLKFPVVDQMVSLKLEHIAEDNRFTARNHHDALNDATNTRGIVEVIRTHQPKLFDYVLSMVDEEANKNMIRNEELFCHVSTIYGYANNCISVQKFLCFHPLMKKRLLTWNLAQDPTELLKRSPEEIAENLYRTKEQKVFEIGFQEIALNQSPLVVKYNLKQTEPAVDKELIQTNLQKFQQVEKALRDLAYATYRIQSEPQEQDVDGGLYDSTFFQDRNQSIRLLETLLMKPLEFDHREIQNRRFSELLLRFQGRNFYKEMSVENKEAFDQYRRAKLLTTKDVEWMTHQRFEREMAELQRTQRLSSEQEVILGHLTKHVQQIVEEIA